MLQHWLVSHVFRNITIFILEYHNLRSFKFMVCHSVLPQPRAVVRKPKYKNPQRVASTELQTPYKELMSAARRCVQLPISPVGL